MDDKKYIPGIYNYCDRWCERCAFTQRCLAFENDPTNNPASDSDALGPDFWEQLRNQFQDAIDMLQNIADKLEESPFLKEEDAPAPEPLDMEKISLLDRYEKGDDYAPAVDYFFREKEYFFRQKEEQFSDMIDEGATVDVEQLNFLHEALSTIRWFQHFIGAKIFRAFSSLDDAPDEKTDLQGDGNGSAKMTMIAIQRSLDAWKFVGETFPELEEAVEQLNVILHRMQGEINQYYPKWARFHRPGFDDEPESVVRLDFNPN